MSRSTIMRGVRVYGLAVALAAAGGIALGPSAAATPADAPVAVRATNLSTAGQERVRNHWTRERMLAATPARIPSVSAAQRQRLARRAVPDGPEGRIPPTPAPDQKATGPADARPAFGGAPWSADNLVTRTTGKVFYTMDGVDYVCSGGTVTSLSDDLVGTAGHCVKDGTGSWATNWAFVPGYDNGNAPYGVWTGRYLMTTAGWAENGDLELDIGMVAMDANGGEHLVDVVGAQGFAWNHLRGLHTFAFGYPAAPPYDGQSLYYCESDLFDDPNGLSTQGMDCDMTGGSSGGPWLAYFDRESGSGWVNSNTSYRYNDGPNELYGPYYGNEAADLYFFATDK